MPVIPKKLHPSKPSTQTTQLGDVISRIRPVENLDRGIQALIYGDSGTGKTSLWSTFPMPALVAICSGGFKSGELKSLPLELYESIHQVAIHDATELETLVNYARTSGHYKTFVLDHISGFQDLVIKGVAGLAEIPVAKTWGMVTQQQYGQATVQCKEYVRMMLGLDMNVVLVAQEREFKNSNDNSEFNIVPKIGASLMPLFKDWLDTAVDYIVRTFIKQKTEEHTTTIGAGTKNPKDITTEIVVPGKFEYCLLTGPHHIFTTKFRMPKERNNLLPPHIVDPSYAKIMELITGKPA